MGAVLWTTQGLLMPYVHGTWFVRFAMLSVLVSAGGLVYGLCAILLGAFSKADLALLLRRKRASSE
jgi:putative peptidoglycan lipid II flippase